ncbi:MAG: S-layer homology domain-containing protein [Clostridia bacterium]|nr:S-layer homology domain-containing protein [Clostridia bacterium]
MKKTISLLLAVVMIAAAFAAVPVSAEAAFSDVEDGRWSAASIEYAVKNGYMNGVGGGKFDPEGALTRAMVATVLWRREGSPVPTAPSGFDDVPAGEWYTDAVAWAKETGVVKGLTETAFGPDEFITREQLATMLFRFSLNAPVSVPERAALSLFADGGNVSDWSEEAMRWAVEAGLLKGTDGNRLAPDGFATREQFAAIIERYDNSFKLSYNQPVLRSHYTEKEYPLVTDADFYVSTTGSDENDGSFDRPFRTWERARDAVRALDKTDRDGIKVAFTAGNYGPISIVLTGEDSGTPECPITYCKYGDGPVVFDNGVTLTEDDFVPIGEEEKAMFNDRYADNIKKIDLNKYFSEIPEFSDFMLFNEQTVMTAARFPNRYADGSDSLMASGETNDDRSLRITMGVIARRIATYSDDAIAGMRVYGYIVAGYRKDTFRAESFDRENGILYIKDWDTHQYGPMRSGWRGADGEGIQMCVTNVARELDFADEYWVDYETGTLYVYDPKGEYRIPMGCGQRLIRGSGYDAVTGYDQTPEYLMVDLEETGYITLRGLSFENAADGILFGYKTSGITIDRCSFSCSTGPNQTLFEFSLDGAPLALTVTDSEFDLSAGSAIWVEDVADGPERYTSRSDVYIDNCLFSRANLTYDVEGAVDLYKCSGGTVSHCRFEKCSRCGVMYQNSFDILIEYNDFDSVMTNSEDGGVTRTWGNMDGNCVIRCNYYNTIAASQGVGRLAQYSDDGDCGTEIYSNLLYNGGDIVFAGAGRDNAFRDNAVVGNGRVIVQSMTEAIKEVGDDARYSWPIYVHLARWNRILEYIATVDGYAEELEARRPGATSFTFDFNDPWRLDFAFAPVTTITGNAYFNEKGGTEDRFLLLGDAADYCTVDGNVGYSFGENPIFVNPTLGDYRIRDGVDFPDIHFEDIGRY